MREVVRSTWFHVSLYVHFIDCYCTYVLVYDHTIKLSGCSWYCTSCMIKEREGLKTEVPSNEHPLYPAVQSRLF